MEKYQQFDLLYNTYINQELSATKIAKLFNCSKGKIYYYLKKYSIKTRVCNYIDGRSIIPNFCIDCSKEINWQSIRCRSCSTKNLYKGEKFNNKGKNNKRYIDGRCSKQYFCIDCGKQISYVAGVYGTGRCRSCSHKNEKAFSYIDGRTLKRYYCTDCGKEISTSCGVYGKKRCKSCANKGENNPRFGQFCSEEYRFRVGKSSKLRWQNAEFKEKTLKAMFKGMHLKPNKPEKLLCKLLNKILPKEYKYVGDGKVILGGFNPDFINCNGQKKIIELYGDYWHNLPKAKIKDKQRLITYKKYGYKTLIVWEHKLKNLDKVREKIVNFNLNIGGTK